MIAETGPDFPCDDCGCARSLHGKRGRCHAACPDDCRRFEGVCQHKNTVKAPTPRGVVYERCLVCGQIVTHMPPEGPEVVARL